MGVDTNATDYSISHRNWGRFWELARKLCSKLDQIQAEHPPDGPGRFDYSVSDYTPEQTAEIARLMREHEADLRACQEGLYEGIQRLASEGEGLRSSS